MRSSGLISTASANSNPILSSSTNGTNNSDVPRTANDIAALVWNFVRSAESLSEGLGSTTESEGGADELKLLRLRTRSLECVIVPGESFPVDELRGFLAPCLIVVDSRFLLVVVHDTPAA